VEINTKDPHHRKKNIQLNVREIDRGNDILVIKTCISLNKRIISQ